MTLRGTLDPLLAAVRGKQLKPTVILLASSLLLMTWKYGGSPQYYLEHFAARFDPWNNRAFSAAAYSFVASLVLLGLVPAAIVRLGFREKLVDYGVGLGDRLRTVRSFLLCAPVFLLVAYVASRDPACREYYPINKGIGASAGMFAQHALLYVLFYLGYEFHFRGFLQFGLRESMGPTNALLVQVLASVLFHIGKPTGEAFGSILVGLLWGILAFRTRSLLSGTLQHFLLGITLDGLITFTASAGGSS